MENSVTMKLSDYTSLYDGYHETNRKYNEMNRKYNEIIDILLGQADIVAEGDRARLWYSQDKGISDFLKVNEIELYNKRLSELIAEQESEDKDV